MRVLVACEFSQIVTRAFRERGHEAFSCDILPTEGNPEWHIQDDVLKHLDDGWDLMIAHPPCTHICRNSSKWFRWNVEIDESRAFFLSLLKSKIKKICIENPVPKKSAKLPPCSQIIQPYQFGHDYSKRTCLWLKGLPKLVPTNVVELTYITTKSGKRYTRGWYYTPRTSKDRSRTFAGIAEAMATQWGKLA